MATQFARTSAVSGPAPFLLGKTARETVLPSFPAAVKAAAERACEGARNPRHRIALFLCELGKAHGCRSDLPLSCSALASTLGISPIRIKRTLALLSLSGIISTDGSTILVLDWRKLAGAAQFDLAGSNVIPDDEDDGASSSDQDGEQDHLMTACGEPACFV